MRRTIKEVCKMFGVSADTLRYYEKVGAIPPVNRGTGGVRRYTEEDIGWVRNAICFKNAGLSVEMIAEYVKLFQQGDDTILERRCLLEIARDSLETEIEKYQSALNRLNYKIGKYEEACLTGVLDWSDDPYNDCSDLKKI